MLTEDGKHLYVNQNEYCQLTEQLAVQIYESNWEFDTVLCLARGGLRVGDILSRIFNKPLAIISTSSYHGKLEMEQRELVIAQHITTPHGALVGRVLMVDDLSDSGATLSKVVEEVKSCYNLISELRTAVLWVKKYSIFQPDYCAQTLLGNPWVHQPFESYDAIRPHMLVEKWKNKKNN
jgi:uncharacterized protein